MARHRDTVTSQTKTRDRVRDLAEVYTHEREVNAMLDMVADMFPSADAPRNIGRTFLEPACGSGNFLVAILERKLDYVTTQRYRSTVTFETAVLRALSSIYGIDIDASNVEHSRQFMHAEVNHHVNLQLNTVPVTDGFWTAVETILGTNIVQADTLADAKTIELVEYKWQRRAGLVLRECSFMEESASDQMDLFAQSAYEPKRDEVPIEYGDLVRNPEPTVAGPATPEGAQ